MVLPEAPPTRKAQEEPDEPAPRMRKSCKLYSPGDVVEIYSANKKAWMTDGEVVAVTDESRMEHGYKVLAGSMKIVYERGTRFKWVSPAQMEEFLRPSPRPRPPPPLIGEIVQGLHNLLGTEWHTYYFELSKGWLRWWQSEDAARIGNLPVGSVYMLGLQMKDHEGELRLR